MKFIKNILLAIGLMSAMAVPAFAQGEFNLFAAPRTIALVYPQGLNAGTSSNFVSDLHGTEGIAKIDLITLTNGACTAATVQFYTSPDRTNWTALANWANATSNSIIYTNALVGSAVQLSTNFVMLPGTITTPTAATAGWASKYLLPASYTNSGAITLQTGLQTIGFSIPDQARYIDAVYVFTGASTNTVAAILTARKQQD